MNELTFLEWIPGTPEDKHVGIAVIKFGGMILRYKVHEKNGRYFLSPGSFKVKDQYTAQDQYIEAFKIDSSYEAERVVNFVLSKVKDQLAKTGVHLAIKTAADNLPF